MLLKIVTDKDGLMIINKSGIIIRLAVSALRVIGRATQGVKLINLKANDEIAAVSKVEMEEDEVVEGAEGDENTTTAGDSESNDTAATGEAEEPTAE